MRLTRIRRDKIIDLIRAYEVLTPKMELLLSYTTSLIEEDIWLAPREVNTVSDLQILRENFQGLVVKPKEKKIRTCSTIAHSTLRP